VGIVCLTPENLEAPWILYESGALSKTVDDKTRLCTYLLGDLQPSDVKGPLSEFQHTRADKEDTRRMIQTINKSIGDADALSENVHNTVFDRMWPDLEGKLKAMTAPETIVKARRRPEEILEEVLELNRRYLPLLDDSHRIPVVAYSETGDP